MSTIASTQQSVSAAVTNATTTGSSDKSTLADNFQTFLTLLTTQLQNQSPLDPLDTNQFTQQLVQFAQVEQQLKANTQLETLVALQKTAQQTQALGFVGTTVAVDGTTAKLANGSADWSFAVSKPATGNLTITSSTGQTVYSGKFTLQAGTQAFSWDGRGTNGALYPDGTYKLSITAVDTSGETVSVATEVVGVVDSVDLTQSPPLLSIDGQNYTLDQIKRVTRPAA